jgi:hypothetical protein
MEKYLADFVKGLELSMEYVMKHEGKTGELIVAQGDRIFRTWKAMVVELNRLDKELQDERKLREEETHRANNMETISKTASEMVDRLGLDVPKAVLELAQELDRLSVQKPSALLGLTAKEILQQAHRFELLWLDIDGEMRRWGKEGSRKVLDEVYKVMQQYKTHTSGGADLKKCPEMLREEEKAEVVYHEGEFHLDMTDGAICRHEPHTHFSLEGLINEANRRGRLLDKLVALLDGTPSWDDVKEALGEIMTEYTQTEPTLESLIGKEVVLQKEWGWPVLSTEENPLGRVSAGFHGVLCECDNGVGIAWKLSPAKVCFVGPRKAEAKHLFPHFLRIEE